MTQKSGSLIVVGTGIRFISQITQEARQAMQAADLILYLADNPTAKWIQENFSSTESLHSFYTDGEERKNAYRKMVERIVFHVRSGKKVCAAFYGHPGVFVIPSHKAIRRLRAEGYPAFMQAGISSIDCLYADAGIDPRTGIQIFTGTDFLLYSREIDPTTPLILAQVDAIGDFAFRATQVKENPGANTLVEKLKEIYSPDTLILIYSAPQLPLSTPRLEWIPLCKLPQAKLTSATLLYLPRALRPDLDKEMKKELGL